MIVIIRSRSDDFHFFLQCPVCFDKLGMCGSVSKTMTHDYCVITLVEGFEEKTVMHLTYSCTHGIWFICGYSHVIYVADLPVLVLIVSCVNHSCNIRTRSSKKVVSVISISHARVFFFKYLHVILILEGTNLKLWVHVQVFAVQDNFFNVQL